MIKERSGDVIDIVKEANTRIPKGTDLYEHKYTWHEVCAIVSYAESRIMEIFNIKVKNPLEDKDGKTNNN